MHVWSCPTVCEMHCVCPAAFSLHTLLAADTGVSAEGAVLGRRGAGGGVLPPGGRRLHSRDPPVTRLPALERHSRQKVRVCVEEVRGVRGGSGVCVCVRVRVCVAVSACVEVRVVRVQTVEEDLECACVALCVCVAVCACMLGPGWAATCVCVHVSGADVQAG